MARVPELPPRLPRRGNAFSRWLGRTLLPDGRARAVRLFPPLYQGVRGLKG